jgi:hypothetical protein
MADDYERLAEMTELTYEQALALKKEYGQAPRDRRDACRPGASRDGMACSNANDQVEAVNFLNQPPPTLPGEASVTNRPDGTVDIYWYGHPSSL